MHAPTESMGHEFNTEITHKAVELNIFTAVLMQYHVLSDIYRTFKVKEREEREGYE
jgi:hypothetical protein